MPTAREIVERVKEGCAKACRACEYVDTPARVYIAERIADAIRALDLSHLIPSTPSTTGETPAPQASETPKRPSVSDFEWPVDYAAATMRYADELERRLTAADHALLQSHAETDAVASRLRETQRCAGEIESALATERAERGKAERERDDYKRAMTEWAAQAQAATTENAKIIRKRANTIECRALAAEREAEGMRKALEDAVKSMNSAVAILRDGSMESVERAYEARAYLRNRAIVARAALQRDKSGELNPTGGRDGAE